MKCRARCGCGCGRAGSCGPGFFSLFLTLVLQPESWYVLPRKGLRGGNGTVWPVVTNVGNRLTHGPQLLAAHVVDLVVTVLLSLL